MKIEQKPEFQPITITLETEEDVDVFWKLVAGYGRPTLAADYGPEPKNLAIKLSDWFSNTAQLGGPQ